MTNLSQGKSETVLNTTKGQSALLESTKQYLYLEKQDNVVYC